MTRLRNAKPERLADGLIHVRVRIDHIYPRLKKADLACGHVIDYATRFRGKEQSTLICPICTVFYRARVGGAS